MNTRDVGPVIGQGTEVAMDMYRCDEEIITNQIKVEEILKEVLTHFSLKELAQYFDEDVEEGGFTFVLLVSGGHIILHSFPEHGYTAVDILCMNGSFIPEEAAIYIRKGFSPDQSKLTVLQRSDVGDILDMKPRRRKMVKSIRRAKNAGAKLKNLVLKTRNNEPQ
jgi:S-adenosylmethionine decarboxylase